VDETAFGFVLVGFRGLAVFQDITRVRVELVALVAVGRFAGDGVMIRLEGGDDTTILTEWLALEDAISYGLLGKTS
jgi:hypothetical protein